jgi:hypothetical protein
MIGKTHFHSTGFLNCVALLPKFCLVPEGADEAGAFTAYPAQRVGGPAGKLPEIAGAQVGQLVLFPITPEVLHGVKFRGISREAFYPDFALQTLQVRPHESAAVGGHAVPDDKEVAFDVSLEVF